jgi:hypothetical protein
LSEYVDPSMEILSAEVTGNRFFILQKEHPTIFRGTFLVLLTLTVPDLLPGSNASFCPLKAIQMQKKDSWISWSRDVTLHKNLRVQRSFLVVIDQCLCCQTRVQNRKVTLVSNLTNSKSRLKNSDELCEMMSVTKAFSHINRSTTGQNDTQML